MPRKKIIFSKESGKGEAMVINNRLSSFDFVVLLVFQCKILQLVNNVPKYLRDKSINFLTAISMLKQVQNNTSELRENFMNAVLNVTK